MHEHSWSFTEAPARWSVSCACGLAVEVAHGRPAAVDAILPTDVMLAGIGSVTRARGELLAARRPGRN